MIQFFDSWTHLRKRNEARRALEGLSDRALNDIGVKRENIPDFIDRKLGSN
ncbi:MAG: DUF1127 domain-containing protein [Pseudomonadota bacterium]